MTAKTRSGPDRGAVFIMPLARRIGRVREVVDRYDRLSGAAAANYQKRVIRQERAALRSLGLHADAIDRELDGFNRAVQRERWNRRYGVGGQDEAETIAGAAAQRALNCLRSAGYAASIAAGYPDDGDAA